jgi:ATP-dependent Clp protease ATP-binding subunit ClpC
MFERFTERARQVVVLAQDEARSLRHNYIGTEHLLLGLLREEHGIAARVLGDFGIQLDAVRAQVSQIAGTGEDVTTGQIPFTPRSKKVLELALREARAIGHQYIGTEHILLGLAREDRGVAAQMLLDAGVGADMIRDAVGRALSGPGGTVSVVTMTAAGTRIGAVRRRGIPPVALLVAGWLLFALALGIGVLIGWAIWG